MALSTVTPVPTPSTNRPAKSDVVSCCGTKVESPPPLTAPLSGRHSRASLEVGMKDGFQVLQPLVRLTPPASVTAPLKRVIDRARLFVSVIKVVKVAA